MTVIVDPELMVKPERAIKYWENKIPTRKSQLRNLSEEAQTRAFIVSRLNRMKQLQQVYDGIKSGMTDGKPIETVVRELKQQGKVQMGTAHLRTVVNTNLKMAYSAGRWEEIQASKDTRPYLQYVALDEPGRTRASHWALNGMIFPVDDPFWLVNMTPNGHNCRCDTITLSQRQVDRLKERLGRDPVIHTKNPIPINKDFAGIPGQPYRPDLSEYQPAFREQFLNDMARHFSLQENGQAQLKRYFNTADAQDAINMLKIGSYDRKAYTKLVNDVLNTQVARGEIMPAGRLPRPVFNRLKQEGIDVRLSLVTIDDKQLRHLQRPPKQATGQALTKSEILQIPDLLKDKNAEWYFDTKDKSVLVMVDRNNDEVIKVAIKTESDNGTPYIVTAGAVDKTNKTQAEYERIK